MMWYLGGFISPPPILPIVRHPPFFLYTWIFAFSSASLGGGEGGFPVPHSGGGVTGLSYPL